MTTTPKTTSHATPSSHPSLQLGALTVVLGLLTLSLSLGLSAINSSLREQNALLARSNALRYQTCLALERDTNTRFASLLDTHGIDYTYTPSWTSWTADPSHTNHFVGNITWTGMNDTNTPTFTRSPKPLPVTLVSPFQAVTIDPAKPLPTH